MAQELQSRAVATRGKLVTAAIDVIEEGGFEAFRVEDVVRRAGVAKGTFFVHFPEKDALMAHLIGEQIEAYIDEMPWDQPLAQVEDIVDALIPLLSFMTSERYVFDVVYTRSASSEAGVIGPVTAALARLNEVVSAWAATGPYRRDVSPAVLAEGVQAFAMQSMALSFSAMHNDIDMRSTLTVYLDAWLQPHTTT